MELDVWFTLDKEDNIKFKFSDWANDTAMGERALSRSPFFPCGHDAFWKVRKLADSGKYETERTDPLTSYVIVPKAELINLVKSLYCNLDHINQRLDELMAFIELLPENKNYTLYSQEF
jgi:hypothetical protein